MLVPPSKKAALGDCAQGAKSSGWASFRLWLSPLPSITGEPKLATIWLTGAATALTPVAGALTAAAKPVASASRLLPAVRKL